jgi:hypothetical protein
LALSVRELMPELVFEPVVLAQAVRARAMTGSLME